MTDCRRLARHLARHLAGASLALTFGCSQPAPTPAPPEPRVHTAEEPSPRTEPIVDAGAPPSNIEGPQLVEAVPPFPELNGMCDRQTWCGNAEAANSRAVAAAKPEPCTRHFEDDGRYFAYDPASTEQRRQAGETATCCYHVGADCVVPGRPLIIDGSAVVAPVVRGPGADARDVLQRQLGELWLDDARAEHASIASFARAALELMAVGAPLELVAGCQRAGLDEVRHAELCLGLAARYLGRDLTLGALPTPAVRAATLAQLAADTFEEGCVGETTATLMAERARQGCADRDVARVWQRIIRDERRHAELAWKTVTWAIGVGGAEVSAAVDARALRCSPAAYREAPEEPALLPHGRLDARALELARRDAWHHVIAPTLALLSR